MPFKAWERISWSADALNIIYQSPTYWKYVHKDQFAAGIPNEGPLQGMWKEAPSLLQNTKATESPPALGGGLHLNKSGHWSMDLSSPLLKETISWPARAQHQLKAKVQQGNSVFCIKNRQKNEV